jgi:hypothetical protein
MLAWTTDSLIQLARLERETERDLRAALLRLGSHVGWDQQAVIRLSEAIAGRPWSRFGAAEVVQVGRALLDVAVALRTGNQTDIAVTGGRTVDLRADGPTTHSACGSCSPIESRRPVGVHQLPHSFDTNAERGG